VIRVAVREEHRIDSRQLRGPAPVAEGPDSYRRATSRGWGRRDRSDGRSRLSRGSVERHTLHVQPIIGTPCDVPVPRNIRRAGTCDARRAFTLREPPGDGERVERSSLDCARDDPECQSRGQGMMMRGGSDAAPLLAST
jgi:hypothetical protein